MNFSLSIGHMKDNGEMMEYWSLKYIKTINAQYNSIGYVGLG